MSKVKINKKLQKSSVLKVVGLVFMVITLLAALVITNNTVRKFITDSFADGGRVRGCMDRGSPSQRCYNEDIREGRDPYSRLLREASRLANCAAKPSTCGLSFSPSSNEANVWFWENLNNYKKCLKNNNCPH